jgi:hypothetical protein
MCYLLLVYKLLYETKQILKQVTQMGKDFDEKS